MSVPPDQIRNILNPGNGIAASLGSFGQNTVGQSSPLVFTNFDQLNTTSLPQFNQAQISALQNNPSIAAKIAAGGITTADLTDNLGSIIGQDSLNGFNKLGQGDNFNLTQSLKNFGAGAQAVGSLVGAYTGLRQLDIAKDSLDFQKESFNKNFANQAAVINDQIRSRQARRRLFAGDDRSNVQSDEQAIQTFGVRG